METVLAMTAATETTRFRVHPQAAHRRVGGEYFVVTGDRAFHRLRLTTAVDLFEAIATRPQSRSDLVALLCSRYRVEADVAGRDLDAFLTDLVDRQLICAEPSASERAA